MNESLTRIDDSALQRAVELLRTSRFEEAAALFAAVLRSDPAQPDALHGLAVVEHRRGHRSRAEQLLKDLIGVHPERVSARYDLACILIEQQRDAEAAQLLESVVGEDSAHAQAWYQLGFVYKTLGREAAAELALRKCLALIPHHAPAVHDLARLYRDRGDYPAALGVFSEATAHPQAGSHLYHVWWQFLSASRLADQGLAALQRGVARFPRDPDLRIDLGQGMEEAGDRVAAEQAYRHALELDPNRGAAIGGLLALKGKDAEAALLSRAETILSDPRARPVAKALVGYGLGKAHHAQGQHAKAFRAWEIANQARRVEAGKLDRAQLVRQSEQLRSSFTTQGISDLAAFGCDDPRPLLVLGMPRSGTTLAEQILSAHPEVEGLGELPDVAIIVDRFCKAHGDALSWPELSTSAGVLIRELAAQYHRVLNYRARSDSQRLIDKTPLNFFNVGLFAALFPQSRVIWCRRDPRDVCLSIYSENFAPSQRYATDLSDLAFYYRQHELLMRHWQSVLPGRILELPYEALVADQQTLTKRMLDFAGLSWDARCLEFYRTERAVQTPSRWQVRQPMYASSVARWRAYSNWLEPLFREFGDGPEAVGMSFDH